MGSLSETSLELCFRRDLFHFINTVVYVPPASSQVDFLTWAQGLYFPFSPLHACLIPYTGMYCVTGAVSLYFTFLEERIHLAVELNRKQRSLGFLHT